MKPQRDDVTAGEYVLGTLTGEDRARFAGALKQDRSLEELVAAWERRLAPLAAAVAPIDPPPDCLAAIEQRIESEISARTIRAEAGDWIEWAPGVAMKLLRRDPADGRRSVLVRLQPGAAISAHDHLDDEECFVIAGEIEIGELRLKAGDYHVAVRGSPHDALVSRGGALLFVRGATGI